MLNYDCYISSLLTDYGLQLVSGTSPQAGTGTLMFQMSNGTWGTVCSHGFDYHAASVACTQLGYDGHLYYGTW